MGVVIDNLLKSLNPYIGGNGDALAAQAGSTNAGFYPMGMVADKNRMDAGKMPAQVSPAQPSPSFDIGKLLAGFAASSAGSPLASPPPGAQYDANAGRWYIIVNGQKQWLDNPGAAPVDRSKAAPSMATPLPERPMIDQSVVENAPWYGQDAPPVQQPYSSPYAPQIESLRQEMANLYGSMMGRQAPQHQEFPMRPGASGLALLGVLAARALGAKPDVIGGFGQGFLGSLQNAEQARYANQMADYERGMDADKLKASLLDQQIKALLGAEDDARAQWNADRAFNEGVRQFNATNARIQSEGEANRASRFNVAQAKAIGSQLKTLEDVYFGRVNASAEDRNNARNQIFELTDGQTNYPPVSEGSVGYQKGIAQAKGYELDNEFANQTFDQRVQTVGAKLQKYLGGIQLDEQKLAKLTYEVENMPRKLMDDHLKASASIASLSASAHLANVKANAGGFAPSAGKENPVTIANQASAIKAVMSNNSARISELQGMIAKASMEDSDTAGDLPALKQQLGVYMDSQAKLRKQLSGIVGVDLRNKSDQDVIDVLGTWNTNPIKAINDINGGMAERANNPPTPTTSAPGISQPTMKDLDERYKKWVKEAETRFGKGTKQYNATVARLNAIYATEKSRIKAVKK